MRLRNRDTGVVVNVADDKPMDAIWEPANTATQPAPAAPLTCATCGFVAKTKAGLGAHARRHDS